MSKPRKQHASEPGYIAERMNPYFAGRKVAIYEAAPQGIDTNGRRFAIVCDAHSAIGCATSLAKARAKMKNPESFCLDCRIRSAE